MSKIGMWRIRFCKDGDVDKLLELSHQVGTGMTSMPTNKAAWRQKIADTQETIRGNEYLGSYFMVLENLEQQEIVGTTAVYTGVNEYRPYYAYQRYGSTLKLTTAFTGANEIGSLYITPDARKPGLGAALAKSRYMLMKRYPGIFHGVVLACCRGWLDDDDNSPFWDQVGKVTGKTFQEAVTITAAEGNQWLSKQLPASVKINKALNEVLGVTHNSSAPAKSMLLKENFHQSDFIDVLDGGPMFSCAINHINAINNTKHGMLKTGGTNNRVTVLISVGAQIDNFSAYITKAEVSGGVIKLSKEDSHRLNRHLNQVVQYLVL